MSEAILPKALYDELQAKMAQMEAVAAAQEKFKAAMDHQAKVQAIHTINVDPSAGKTLTREEAERMLQEAIKARKTQVQRAPLATGGIASGGSPVSASSLSTTATAPSIGTVARRVEEAHEKLDRLLGMVETLIRRVEDIERPKVVYEGEF